MAAPSGSAVLRAGVLAFLLATVVHCNGLDDYDPLQPTTSDETVSVGGTVTLTCRVDESDNSSLQWSNTAQQTLYFGEKRALRDNRIQLHRSTSTELSITIAEVQLADEGEYTCSIFTMPVRTARASVTVLGVPTKPQISGSETAVPEGDEVTLTCTSSGSKPPAELHWYRGTERLTARPDVVESTPGEPTYSVRSEVTLTVSRGDDNELVTCAVVHPSLAPGDKRSAQALHVLYSPDVKIHPQTDLPKEGERFRLTCEGSGNPEPNTFTWKKKDGELGPLVKIDGAYLYFEMLNKSDNGVYECHAGNGIGAEGQGEYTLFVQDSDWTPTPPTSVSPPTSAPETSETTPAPPGTSVSDESQMTTALSNVLFPDSAPDHTHSSHDHHDHTHPDHDHTHPDHDHAHPDHDHAHPDHDHTHPDHDHAHPEHDHAHPDHDHTHPDHDHAHPDHDHTHPDRDHAHPDHDHAHPGHDHAHHDNADHDHSHSHSGHAPSVTTEPSGGNTTDPTAMAAGTGVDHAVIGGVVAVIVFILLCLLIVLGRYLIRHKGTYLTHEAKGSDDAPDADTAIINAEGGTSGAEDKKEYFI